MIKYHVVGSMNRDLFSVGVFDTLAEAQEAIKQDMIDTIREYHSICSLNLEDIIHDFQLDGGYYLGIGWLTNFGSDEATNFDWQILEIEV